MSEDSAVNATAKDWHSSKHMWKRARYLLDHPDEQILSDVTFLVGDGSSEPQKVFQCHKFILAMFSAVFQAMFYGSLPQADGIIKIPDVTPTAFYNMLKYAYGQNGKFSSECLQEAMDTLYCAKRYLISKLARSCREQIQLLMVGCERDACVVLQMAPQMDEDDLAALALGSIALTAPQILQGDNLLSLSFDYLRSIVDYVHLNAKEADVYQGVRRWVEHNVGVVTGSALRSAFGALLYSIRFPLFSAAELVDGPIEDGVLTADESVSVFRFLFGRIKPELPFITTPRIPLAAPLIYFFDLVTAPGTAVIELSVQIGRTLHLDARPDLAPECCRFFRHLVENQLHIEIGCHDNEHLGKTVPLPEGVLDERNILLHSIMGACWFEWDAEDGTIRNIRVGSGRKPDPNHSAVFGFVFGKIDKDSWMPFDFWNNTAILGVANFRTS